MHAFGGLLQAMPAGRDPPAVRKVVAAPFKRLF
jgi:hypothetical protein